jgi:hypothetical protein
MGALAMTEAPPVRMPSSDERELLNLCAEISRLRIEADRIEVQRVWPHEQQIKRVLCGEGTRRERMDAAEAYALQSGLRQASDDVSQLVAHASALVERALDIPARNPPARRAKAETLIAHLAGRGWESEDEIGFQALRSMLRELAAP